MVPWIRRSILLGITASLDHQRQHPTASWLFQRRKLFTDFQMAPRQFSVSTRMDRLIQVLIKRQRPWAMLGQLPFSRTGKFWSWAFSLNLLARIVQALSGS